MQMAFLGLSFGKGEQRVLDEIVPGIFLGSFTEARCLSLLTKYRITHILNVAANLEAFFPEKFVYRCVPLQDIDEEDLLSHVPANNEYHARRFIVSALLQGGRVFVHCAAGISRSAATIIAYLMWTERVPFRRALEIVRAKHPRAQPIAGFVRQLVYYERELLSSTDDILQSA